MRLVSPRAKNCIHTLPCNVYVKHCIDSSSQNASFKLTVCIDTASSPLGVHCKQWEILGQEGGDDF